MISALNKQPDGTLNLTITIPQKRVKKVYEATVSQLVKTAEIKGFRKGKAPRKLVEEKLEKNRVYEEVLKQLVTEVYVEAVKEHQLKPIVNPQIQVVSMPEGKDWVIKAVTCELPEVKLGQYKEAVRKALATDKIWVPGKDEVKENPKASPEGAEKENQKLAKIFAALLEAVKVQVPTLLIENETNGMLSRLLDQTSRLGLTIEQYLASLGKTSEQIRAEYRQKAEEQLQLELVLSAIADQEAIKVKESEVEAMIKAVPDEKTRQSVDTPAQRAYIRQILRKRAVIDSLVKL
jgi:FKBP-type peptidyl-prolyl cis-trans isomerase (trigger factor)